MSEVTSPPDGRPSDPAIVAAEPAAARSIAREFVRADRGRVLDIFETVYGREFRDNFDRLLDWQYLDNPYKPEGVPCSMVVEEDGRIVGFMGFYYSPTQVGPDVFPSCWIIGFVTDPDARGSAGPRFVRQASRSIDPVPVLLGNPGTHILRFWSWFKAGVCTTVPIMIRPVGLEFIAREKLPAALAGLAGASSRAALKAAGGTVDRLAIARARRRGVVLERVESFGPELDGLWRRVRRLHPNMTLRDRDYLNWRYVDCPLAPYVIFVARIDDDVVGYAASRVFDSKRMRKAVIVDLLADGDDPVITRALVARSMQQFRAERVNLAYAIAPCQSLLPVLESMGFVARWDDAGGTRFVMGRVNVAGTAAQADFFDDRRWFVSFGDADYDLVSHLL
ncbi:MAG: GNAT family N-acetyltransferase [Deltaproteobacteria bacterium]|nr:GNAT family N-acetyltransferase [Deltaproteobacteria bacterium]